MNRKNLFSTLIAFLLAVATVSPTLAQSSVQSRLAQVRRATAKYHDPQAAKAAGYGFVPGVDYCFDNPGVGAMGYHLINTSLMNGTVDPLKPQALVYAPTRDGGLELVAVEYIVPFSAWTGAQPPSLFGHTFEANPGFENYSLHAWIFKANSLGMFSDWNPKVSCNP